MLTPADKLFFFSWILFLFYVNIQSKQLIKKKEVETQIEGQLLWIFRLKYLTFQNNFMNTSRPAILKLKWFQVVDRWWKKMKTTWNYLMVQSLQDGTLHTVPYNNVVCTLKNISHALMWDYNLICIIYVYVWGCTTSTVWVQLV